MAAENALVFVVSPCPSPNKAKNLDAGGSPFTYYLSSEDSIDGEWSNKVQETLVAISWIDDEDGVVRGLKALCKLCSKSNECAALHRETLCEVGFSTIVNVMNKWKVVPEIQAEACKVLQNASIFHRNSSPPLNLASDCGIFEAIFLAMKSYPDNLFVQQWGCGALMNLCCCKENADYVVKELDGIYLIVVAMKDFPTSPLLQAYACAAFYNLSQWEEYKKPIVNAGGLIALASAITNHADTIKRHHKAVWNSGWCALKRLQ
jgi:hypothetical protein